MPHRQADTISLSAKEMVAFLLSRGMSREALLHALTELCPSESESTSYFTLLSDSDLPDHLQSIVKNWRKLATSLAYTGPVAWKVKAGFTLKQHAPQAGPCYKNFSYLQDWSFSDEPTQESIVFWIPRILSGSVKKNVSEQTAHLAELRAKTKLPAHHLASFGSVILLAGLILAHFKETGERVPLDGYCVRSDSCDAGGDRLGLGVFDEDGLRCVYWNWGEDRNGDLGVFALGVELGSSGT